MCMAHTNMYLCIDTFLQVPGSLWRPYCPSSSASLHTGPSASRSRWSRKWDRAWLEWSVNCIMMSMYLYISCTYKYVLVCTKRRWKVERRHTGPGDVGLWQMKLGVLNEYMVVHKQTNAAWLPRTVHVVQPVHTYILGTWYVLGTYQYVLRSPNNFWGYYVFTFDNGIRYCVYWTGMWWFSKPKTMPDFMAIIHVIIPVYT